MNYIFDFFGTLVTDDIKTYKNIMTKNFGLDERDYTKINNFISQRNFDSKEIALKELLRFLNISITNKQKDRFFLELNEWMEERKTSPYTLEVLRNIKQQGSKIAILSNNNIFIEEIIQKKSIDQYVDLILLSNRIGFRKPDPKIYELCLKKMNSKPSQTMMIGDNLQKDVIVPRQLGINSILFDPRNEYRDYSGKKISSLLELIN